MKNLNLWNLAVLMIAVILLMFALPSAASGPGASRGMANRSNFTGLDASPIVLLDSAAKIEAGTLTILSEREAIVSTPTRTFRAFQATAPPADWSGAVFWDLRSKETAVVVMHPITTYKNVFGRRDWSLDFGAFAGATTKTRAAVAGVYVGKTFPLADRVRFGTWLGFTGQLGGSIGAGVGLSLNLSF